MTERNDINRRDFVTFAVAATAAALCVGTLTPCLRADDAPATKPAATAISIGPKSDFSKDGFTTTWEKAHRFIVARQNGKIYAMTSRCTHKGCDIKVAPTGDHFLCPCHRAQFNPDGTVLKGPAKVSLVRYAIAADTNGILTVDPSQPFTDQHWDDPASFVTVDAAK